MPIHIVKPSRCICETCPIHGHQVTAVFQKNAQLKRDIIVLATRYEEIAKEMPDTVSEALSAAASPRQALSREFAGEVWGLLGECMCRTPGCGHPASFHSEDGACQVCQKGGCWA